MLNLFLPSGVPTLLLPLIFIIEVISFFIRPLSLAIRLFANMMAGHTLLHIVVGFVAKLCSIHFLCAVVPFLFMLGIIFLEFGIACLQAYVFVVLLAIYFHDSLYIHE
jgi:F-type H+-transporting ATPase subunit a